MKKFTLDTNCIIDLEENRPDAGDVRKLVRAWKDGLIQLAVVAVSASENQRSGNASRNFSTFEQKLERAGLTGVEVLPPLAIWDVFYWDHALWSDDAKEKLESQIRGILFPGIPTRPPVDKEKNSRWRNQLCDVLVAWSHSFHKLDYLVTRDRNFHARRSELMKVGIEVVSPRDASVDYWTDPAEKDGPQPAIRSCPDKDGRCTLSLPSYEEISHVPNCDCKERSRSVSRLMGQMYYGAILSQQALERQRQAWDRSALAWTKWDAFLMQWLRPIGEAILAAASLKEDHHILDVGCGTGELGLMAAPKVTKGKVVGVDFSDQMVAAATRKAQCLGVKNYKAQAAEASALPFEEETFDAVIGRHVVMLLQNKAWSLKQLVRVMKPRGRLVLSSWGPMERNPWMTVGVRAIEGVLGRDVPMSDGADGPGPFQCSEQNTLTSLFTKADVTNKHEVSEVSGELAFESPEHYWRFLSQVVGRVASALKGEWKDRRQEIRRAVVRAAKGHVRDGRLTLGWSALVASGAKPRKRPYSIRLEVEFADCTGKVWHRHESVYPKPRISDEPADKPPADAPR